jgi:hypothetical protein
LAVVGIQIVDIRKAPNIGQRTGEVDFFSSLHVNTSCHGHNSQGGAIIKLQKSFTKKKEQLQLWKEEKIGKKFWLRKKNREQKHSNPKKRAKT